MDAHFEEHKREALNVKADEETISTFENFKAGYKINYKKISDDDVLFDAWEVAECVEQKRLLVRYRRVKNEAYLRDHLFTNKIVRNYFSVVKKVGILMKKEERSWVGKWEPRFVVLTNAGFIYFNGESL